MSRVRRVHHPDAAAVDGEIVLSREESHHVARVLRLRPGDAVSVFDGRGREWEGALDSIHGDLARVRIGAEIRGRTDPGLEVVLFQSLCRADRMEWVIQKSTEIGVAAIRPIRTERVEGRAPDRHRLERWRRIALEACKQSGRRTVPEIADPDELPAEPPSSAVALLLASGAGHRPLSEYLVSRRPETVWLAVGPEGGFSAGEVVDRAAGGWSPAGLGPRVLRTETAGVVAATLVLHAFGDLGTRSGPDV